ncbi:unnamed protein product, partial [Meganyctiphanes norvegica]
MAPYANSFLFCAKFMGGTRVFLMVNLGILLLNAMLGIFFNLATFTSRRGLRGNSLPLLSTVPANFTMIETSSELLPAFGILDNSGNYTSHPFVWAAQAWPYLTESSHVCLTTQSSVDRLFWLAWQAEAWTGPISVSVFAPGSNYAVAAAMISYLRQCFPNVRDRVSFHLVHTRTKPPIYTPYDDFSALNCETPEDVNNILMSLKDENEPPERRYPQNMLRNLAKRTCKTFYSITIDIDMLTPPYMSENINGFLTKHSTYSCRRCTYVIPVYELEKSVSYPPNDKEELLILRLRGKARSFHIKVYDKNQGNSHLQFWEVEPNKTADTAYSVLYNITSYEEFWEPILLQPYTAPLFDERFIGYGFTRSSQVYELAKRGYSFKMLDNAFLTHRGFQTTENYENHRWAQIEINKLWYQVFKRELHARLGLPPPAKQKPSPLHQQVLG